MFGALLGDLDDDPFFGKFTKMPRTHRKSKTSSRRVVEDSRELSPDVPSSAEYLNDESGADDHVSLISGQMRRMNTIMDRMMSDMMGMPMMGMRGMLEGPQHHQQPQRPRHHPQSTEMMPFQNAHPFFPMGMGLAGFDQLFDPSRMQGNDNMQSFCHSSVMTMTTGPDGRPQVYQASSTTKQAPGGLKEVKKTVADTRTGIKKMQIGHHIGERAHVREREQNMRSGELEEREEFINLEEEEADHFNREWETRTRPHRSQRQLTSGSYNNHRRQLALPSSSSRSIPLYAVTSSSRNRNSGWSRSRSTLPSGGQQEMSRKRSKHEGHQSHVRKQAKTQPIIELPDSD